MKYTKKELQEQITTMEEVMGDDQIPASTKDAIRGSLNQAKKLLKELEDTEPAPADKPTAKDIAKAVTSSKKKVKKAKAKKEVPMTKAQKKTLTEIVRQTEKYAAYRGKSEADLQRDSSRKAKKPGSRTSASGKTYREYRTNRTDITAGAPHLAKGGKVEKISDEIFHSQYRPKINHIVRKQQPKSVADEDITSWSGTMYETYGEEEAYIKSLVKDKKKAKTVWTIVEGDDDNHIIAGYHYVDRMGYIVTEKPWKTGNEMVVEEFAKGGNITKEKSEKFYNECVTYLKKEYGIGPDDMDLTREKTDAGLKDGETAAQLIDAWSDDYNLTKLSVLQRGFSAGGKLSGDQFYQQAVDYLKNAYQLEPNDMDLTKEKAEQAQRAGETPVEFIDYYGEKYDLIKWEDWDMNMAKRTMRRHGFAKGGRLPKADRVTLMTVAMYLASYKNKFRQSQNGYTGTEKLIADLYTNPTDVHYLNLAGLSLMDLKSMITDAAAQEQIQKLINKLQLMVDELNAEQGYAKGGTRVKGKLRFLKADGGELDDEQEKDELDSHDEVWLVEEGKYGRRVPELFIKSHERYLRLFGFKEEKIQEYKKVLSDPDNKGYDKAWKELLANAKRKDGTHLHQESEDEGGDLWLVPAGYNWDDDSKHEFIVEFFKDGKPIKKRVIELSSSAAKLQIKKEFGVAAGKVKIVSHNVLDQYYSLGIYEIDDDNFSEEGIIVRKGKYAAAQAAAPMAAAGELSNKLRVAIEDAEIAFWGSIAGSYPEAETGDFSPEDTFAIRRAMETAVKRWLEENHPQQGGSFAKGGTRVKGKLRFLKADGGTVDAVYKLGNTDGDEDENITYTAQDLIDKADGDSEYDRRDAEAEHISTIEGAIQWFLSLEYTVSKDGQEITMDDFEQEQEEETEQDQPDFEQDSFIRDISRGGYDVTYAGKYLGHSSEMDEALEMLNAAEDKDQFFTNRWFISDHGNGWLIDREGNEIKMQRGGDIATANTQMTVFGYTSGNFTFDAKWSFTRAVLQLNKEEDRQGAYYLRTQKAIRELAQLVDIFLMQYEKMDTDNTAELLQRIGALNYQTGYLVNTQFLNKHMDFISQGKNDIRHGGGAAGTRDKNILERVSNIFYLKNSYISEATIKFLKFVKSAYTNKEGDEFTYNVIDLEDTWDTTMPPVEIMDELERIAHIAKGKEAAYITVDYYGSPSSHYNANMSEKELAGKLFFKSFDSVADIDSVVISDEVIDFIKSKLKPEYLAYEGNILIYCTSDLVDSWDSTTPQVEIMDELELIERTAKKHNCEYFRIIPETIPQKPQKAKGGHKVKGKLRFFKEKGGNPSDDATSMQAKVDRATSTPITNLRQVRTFIYQCVNNLVGIGFHPDTDFEDYVDENGNPVFTKEQADRLELKISEAILVCSRNDADIYKISLEILNPGKAKKGGRLKSALNRDRTYKSNQPHEQAYHRKTKPKNPRYNTGETVKRQGKVQNRKTNKKAASKIAGKLKKKR